MSSKHTKKTACSIELESSQVILSNRARPAYERDLARHKKKVAAQIASAEGRPVVRMFKPLGQCELIGVLIRENPKTLIVGTTTLLGHPEQGEQRFHKTRVHTEKCPRCPDHPNPVIHPALTQQEE